ncbi:MAG: efflux RND transporter periplasmic adaptor subunit [Thermoanaerobaculia bacterium]
MLKRMIIMLVAVAAVLAVLGGVKYRQVQAAIAQNANFQPPPETVTTVVAGHESWNEPLGAIGTVTAVQGVTVSADLPGIVERISFDSGSSVAAGAVLVKLDTKQEAAQLRAAEAQLELAEIQLGRIQGLREKGVASQAEYDLAIAEHAQASARVGEIRATIDRKTIRAPFSGILGIRQVNLGQYLNGGDPVVPLQSLDPIYVDFSVPQQQVGRVAVDTAVQVAAEGAGGAAATGKVTAIDSVVDPATRNLQVQAEFDNAEGALRPGMFVEVQVDGGARQQVITLPASSIAYAPYGNSVFIVEDMEGPNGQSYKGVRQEFVQLGGTRGDQVAVLSGVKLDEEVATSGVFKLRAGGAVVVNNDVQPGNDPAPRPENT